jgi:S-methylmethionine-dependent homocysteine/selenocysteine methylase
MDFAASFKANDAFLLEGAIGERLKREYNIKLDDKIAMAGLIYDSHAKQALADIFEGYLKIAEDYHLPFLATTPTRRANKERINLSDCSEDIIADNVRFLQQIRNGAKTDMYVGGLMGCKGDAYKATDILSVEEAEEFHSWQAELFQKAGADFLLAGIMPAISEAVGMAKAMEKTGLPYLISFMIRKDGKLIDGTTIHHAIQRIDSETKRKPIGYMTNCIHPIILKDALACPFNQTELVKERFCGIQANTSPLSPEELDNCEDLKSSDAINLANAMMELNEYFTPKIFGGCCGTDKSHMVEIAKRI